MSSRFVPVQSEEELKRYYDAGLLYFNHSIVLPRGPEWKPEKDGWLVVLSDYRCSLSDTDRSEARILPEDWGYLVEDDSKNEEDEGGEQTGTSYSG